MDHPFGDIINFDFQLLYLSITYQMGLQLFLILGFFLAFMNVMKTLLYPSY